MATEVDLQRLVVQMEASFTKYQREWQKALGTTDTNVKKVQTRFDGMSKSISNAGSKTARALDPIAGQTGNIAAQFQDIAVQLQGGQSPFLIAMQQGTQLSAVLSQSKSPIAALSAGFMQMVNPISIATIAAIALGGAAAQYLGTLLGDGKSATDVIKEQNDTIRRVAENWGEAVPSLKAYVDQLDRAAQVSDTNQAYDALVGQEFEQAKAQLEDIRVGFVDARVSLQQFGSSAQEIDALQSEFDTLRGKVADNTATTEDLERLQSLLAGTVGSESIPALVQLGQVLSQLLPILGAAASGTARLRTEQAALNNSRAGMDLRERYGTQQFITEQQRINGLTADQLSLETEIARVKSEADRDKATLSDAQALGIAQERLAAEERRSQLASSGKSAAKEADREREAVTNLIAELEHEFELLGMTEQQKAVANALRRAGAAATDAERQAITDLVNATIAEESAMRATNEQMREFADAGRQAMSGFIQDMMAGKNATEALGNALGNIGDRLINLGLDALFGTGGSSFGALGQLFNFGGARAAGGPVNAGQTYLVGEKGPELFTPPASGKIIANDRLGGGGASVTFAPIIDARGADAASVARLERSMLKMAGEMDGRVKQIVRTQGRKWK